MALLFLRGGHTMRVSEGRIKVRREMDRAAAIKTGWVAVSRAVRNRSNFASDPPEYVETNVRLDQIVAVSD